MAAAIVAYSFRRHKKLKYFFFFFYFLFKKQITIGIHCGEVMTGVIGQRMPRYCLFGNTVNLTSRTETTGTAGRINVSEDAYKWIQFNSIIIQSFKS